MTETNKPTLIFKGQQPMTRELVFLPQDIVLGEATQEQIRASLPATRTGEQLQEGARLWQSKAYIKWLGLDKRRGVLDAGTGAGKTRFAIATMHNHFHEHNPADKPAVVVWLVPLD